MLKSLKNVLILCLVAVFGTFIVLEALGFKDGSGAAEESSATASGTETAERVSSLDDAKPLGETIEFIDEPHADDIVSVLVSTQSEPLLAIANERGISLAELHSGFDGDKLYADRTAEISRAIKSLAGLIRETSYRYTGVFNGFAAKVRYGDIAKIEAREEVSSVILSNTYESPKAITENDVNVQDTGIFNSIGVGYDGTGTVVAVLDTGTDYTHEVFDMELDPDKMAITKDDVAAAVPYLSATSMSAALEDPEEIDEDELYLTSKLPYAFDYADIDTNVYPEESHGTHVAGIIAGESWRIRGVAPRAQIATFKVFQDTGNSSSEGILAALNDAVELGVDAINMSLGATCGFSREDVRDQDGAKINAVYDLVEQSGVSLVVAAGNEYSSSYGGANGNTNLASNPDSGTVGSPASYYASFAVASVSGVKTPYFIANGEKEIYFNESRTTGKKDPNNFVQELLGGAESGEYQYVVIPGVGYEANYTGIDVKGKIAVIKRGSNSFEDKVKIAKSKGAVAAIIYNHLSGMLNMSIGTVNVLPSCLISMDFGKYLVSNSTGTIRLQKDYLAGPFMSDFSSWGPLPNLELTPDITGHGGDITSSFAGGNEYDTISGTSMACPNIAGALVLVREYVKTLEGVNTTPEVRDLSYNLMMSTATIARNEEGNPYSPRKQGAGIGDIYRSVNTKAYLSVEGSNKAKLSLKDDPTRKGEYVMKFNITNLSAESLSYNINPIVMTESMSSDGKTVAEKAYMLSPSSTYAVKAKSGQAFVSGSAISLGGYAEAEITVTVKLSAEDRNYLNTNFINGMYVEGYIELQSYNADKINLNIPFLAFYGNWEDAPMLDVSAYEVGESAVDSSVLEEDKLVADVYGTLPMAGFDMTDDYGNPEIGSWGLGAFGYNIAQGYETPVTRERYASLTHSTEGNYLLYAIAAGLFRNAKRVNMEIRDSVTGELVWSRTSYNARKSHSNGGDQAGGAVRVEFNVNDYNLVNNGKYTFSMECFLDWMNEGDEDYSRGNRNTFSFEFYIDDEKPVLESTYVRDENHRKTVEFNVHDNHYLQAFVLYTYSSVDAQGEPLDVTSISNGVIPVYNGEFNGSTTVSYDVTAYWDLIEKNGGKLYVEFMDYAKNSQYFKVDLNDHICTDVRLEKTRTARDEYTINPNGQLNLKDYIRVSAMVEGQYAEGYWVEDPVWESSVPSVAEVSDKGLVVGKEAGQTVITVHPKSGDSAALTFTVNVSGDPVAPSIREVELSDYSVSLERGESKTISASILPASNAADAHITWSSTSANVSVTPDPADPSKATIKALRSGSAMITARVDGTYINASCSVRVKEEYYVDSVYLKSYTGRGDENGVVKVPDDLGIAYIYPMAFFNNPYITKIILPEGVQYIMNAGIYGCDNLEEIVLPESCIDLQTFSVAWNPKLKKINTEHVQTIGARAFVYDTALETIDLRRVTYIGALAFVGCSGLKSVDLSKVGTIGEQAFADCFGLTELVLPENTSMGMAAFYECTGLKRLTVYGGQIGLMAFQNCTGLTDVTFVGDVDIIEQQAFYGCTALKNVNFLGSVYEIGDIAFAGCTAIESFKLPAGLTKLGRQVFANCNGIRKMEVDKDAHLLELDIGAFVGTFNLTEFVVEEGNKYLASQDGVLYDKSMDQLIAYPYGKDTTTFRVPESVRVIGQNAFAGVDRIRTIDLTNVERVAERAFQECTANIIGTENLVYIGASAFQATSITTFPISEATKYIGDLAFYGCTSVTQSALDLSGVEYVGNYAFLNCPIKSVAIGDDLKEVGIGAFAYCTALTSVDFGGLTSIAREMFYNCTALTRIEIPATIEEIGMAAFYHTTSLTNVTFNAKVTALPEYCFFESGLTSFKVPGTLRSIGAHAFESTSLTSFDFNYIETIGESAFEDSRIGSVQAPNLKEIGARAFYDTNVSTVTASMATSVGSYAFARCTSLTQASLPRAKSIGSSAFDGCTKLRNLYIGAAETIGSAAFRNTSELRNLTIDSAQTIGANAFDESGIATLNLPNLRSVEERAFSGATSLRSIDVGLYNNYFLTEDGVLYQKNSGNFYTLVVYPLGRPGTEYSVKKRTIKIGAYAFYENTNLTKIVLPEHLKVIGVGAFYRASKLERIEIGAVAAPTLESIGTKQSGGLVNTYNNFKDELGRGFTMQWIVPKNATGYDSYIWREYLGQRIERTNQDAINSSALNFIDRVNALPLLSGDERAAEITSLLSMYNMLDATQKQFSEVADAYARLRAAGGVSYVVEATEPAAAEQSGSAGSYAWIAILAAVLAVACGAVLVICRKHTGRREK